MGQSFNGVNYNHEIILCPENGGLGRNPNIPTCWHSINWIHDQTNINIEKKSSYEFEEKSQFNVISI